MNVGNITTPTARGQIVIPADYRRALKITSDTVLSLRLVGGGIYVQPMVVTPDITVDDGAFLAFLQKHRGFMAGDQNFTDAALQKRKKKDIARQKRLKKLW